MPRYIAITDIHGELDKLNNLLSKLNTDKEDIFVFMGDYIDNTFSGYVYDFDFYDMENLWFNMDLFENEDLYKYEDFPITVNKGRHVIV
jgi:Icc-related predicted phosphoesterase